MDISNKTFLTVKIILFPKKSLTYTTTKRTLITYPQPSLDNLGKYYESEDYISHTDGNDRYLKKHTIL
jgi:hypothetical protein